MKALRGAAGLFNNIHQLTFALNVIEWADEKDESSDSEMMSKIEEEERRMLRSVVVSTKKEIIERIVKVGDPSSKIVELAEELDVELIMMGSTGIGNSDPDQELGHVGACLASKPVVSMRYSNESLRIRSMEYLLYRDVSNLN